MQYPIYLKYPNDQTFIKIESESEMEEIKYMGKKKSVTQIKANTFPDKIYIQDVVQYVLEGKLIQITEEKYELERRGL